MHPKAPAWSDLLPSWRTGATVLLLFALALGLSRAVGPWLAAEGARHALAGMALLFLSSAIAVLAPMATNLPLVPFAALAYGPGWTAALLLGGWVAGATLSFMLGRQARALILRRCPTVQRHADIDRLIAPQHRLLSLVLLRMTFPVDLLSYALGLFSPRTTAAENALSTALGAAPFALLFAVVPTLDSRLQAALLVGSSLLFIVYAAWMLRRTPAPPSATATGTAEG